MAPTIWDCRRDRGLEEETYLGEVWEAMSVRRGELPYCEALEGVAKANLEQSFAVFEEECRKTAGKNYFRCSLAAASKKTHFGH